MSQCRKKGCRVFFFDVWRLHMVTPNKHQEHISRSEFRTRDTVLADMPLPSGFFRSSSPDQKGKVVKCVNGVQTSPGGVIPTSRVCLPARSRKGVGSVERTERLFFHASGSFPGNGQVVDPANGATSWSSSPEINPGLMRVKTAAAGCTSSRWQPRFPRTPETSRSL